MADYTYLIVGGGMTGDAACRGIRDHDMDGSIGLFGREPHEPYARPPLTKALWKGKEEDSIWRGTSELGVELHPGREIASVDLDARTATDDGGTAHSYERLLLATGGSRDSSRTRPTASSTTAPSTTTTSCARSSATACR